MTTRTKRMGLAIGALLFVAYLGWDMVAGLTGGPASGEAFPAPIASPTIARTPDQSVVADSTSERVVYSIDMDELAGLSASAPPGSATELWVTWDRPLVARPKLQRIVRDAVLEQITPPLTPDGPTVATFLVSRKKVADLLLADRYGALSATIRFP